MSRKRMFDTNTKHSILGIEFQKILSVAILSLFQTICNVTTDIIDRYVLSKPKTTTIAILKKIAVRFSHMFALIVKCYIDIFLLCTMKCNLHSDLIRWRFYCTLTSVFSNEGHIILHV